MTAATAYAPHSKERFTSEERERLILENLPMVHWIASRIFEQSPAGVSRDDLVSTGVLGLIAAIDNFDTRYNVKLGTYAQHRIRGAILDSLPDRDGLSGYRRTQAKQVEKAIALLEQRLQRVPEEEEIAAELGMQAEEYRGLLVDLRGVTIGPLEATGDDASGRAMIHWIADDGVDQPSEQLERAELEGLLARGVNHLPEKERIVLSLYYREDLTLREIGEVMKVHLTRVSQLKAQAILRLRAFMDRYWPSPRGIYR